jgi:site-specific DNA recombinase
MRWNEEEKWIFSEEVVHPPVIDDATFRQTQQLLAAKSARKVVRRPRSSPRPYVSS